MGLKKVKFLNLGRFTVINESFDCAFCGLSVPPLQTGCRNHCPFCLSSLHVDVFPGDRQNNCLGQLKATGYENSGKKGLMLLFTCMRCGAKTRNKAATEDAIQPDSYDKILSLSLSKSSSNRLF